MICGPSGPIQMRNPTISATGKPTSTGGFTLIELILVIGLIAFAGSLIIMNADALLLGLGDEPPERIFQKAVREARYQAAFLKESTRLRYEPEGNQLNIETTSGQSLAQFSLGKVPESGRINFRFEQILPERGLETAREETTELQAIVFRPDRSSTPFIVRIEADAQSFTQRYDPFSAIVINDSRTQ